MFHGCITPALVAGTRDFASVMKSLVTHRSPLGDVARRVFGKAKTPRIVRLDARVARMSMRVARDAPSHVRNAVIATAAALTGDRIFIDVPSDFGQVGICAERSGREFHVIRVDRLGSALAVSPVASVLTLPDEAPDVDWEAVAHGRWATDPGADLKWDLWAAENMRAEDMPWAAELPPLARAFLAAEAQVPDLITLALSGVLPRLPLDDPELQDWAQGPVAGNA